MRNNGRNKLLFPALVLAAVIAVPAAHAAAGPMADLKKANQNLNQLAQQNAADKKFKSHVNRLLDYSLLARNTLRDHWAKRSQSERNEFTTTFRALIEKNYIKGLRKKKTYNVVYQRESVLGGTATVYTQVKYLRKGRERETEISYKMRKTARGWVVYDVVTDDVSMERNYRNSFNRIIKRKGWGELIRKMKKKLNS